MSNSPFLAKICLFRKISTCQGSLFCYLIWILFKPFMLYSSQICHFRQNKNLQEVRGRTSSPAWNLWNLLYIAPLRRLLSGILQLKIWTMISLLYSGPRYGSVQFMFSNGKLCKLSRTFKIVNRQFIQFARIPVACL